MKFSVSSSALLSLLATTGKVISNKNTLPILDYFLMELKGDQLKVTTSDLETTLVGQITVDNVESEGMIAAPAKQLLDSLKEFAEIPLTIDCNDQTFEIKLNWKSGSLSIPGASAVSYPALPALAEDKKELTFDVDTLVNGINKTIFATADDELRPIMNGVYINIEPASITFVATDAHKLVKYSSEQPSELTAAFILPKKPANLLKGMLLKEEAPVKVSFDSKNVLFNLKNHTLVCRLIEGSYPNYNAVIPTANPNKVLIDRIELVNGIKRVAVCSNPATNLIRMDHRPHRTGQRHQARGRLLESGDQPHPHGHRRQQDQPHGAGHRLLDVGQRDDLVQLRRTVDHHRVQVDLPRRDPLEHRDADGGDRAGRFYPCGRFQARL